MLAPEIPLYLDWSFWAVVVAAIAVILSQLPPIHELIKKAKIDLELYSKISITHKVGNPNLQFHLIISNIGGRKIRIKDIKATIERDGKYIATLPVQNYLQNQTDQNTVLFTAFSLKPGDEWAHIVNLFNFFDRETESEYRKLEAKILSDFNDKQLCQKEETKALIEVDNSVVLPFQVFFDKHFIWRIGEYLLKINIITNNNAANIEKKYRFTIFESHEEQLKVITEHFKYGGGIWWNPQIQTNVIIEIKEA